MIPLIDAFFLLLAFFMSSVITMEVVQGLPLELPRAGPSKPLASGDRWMVTVTREGAVQLEGRAVTLEELRSRLAGHPDLESLRVGIRADQATPYERVVQVLAAAQASGVKRVNLLTSGRKEKER
ncbi:MAG: biopolymer transporter ExbD [Candidatus Omnitrophica bacterium]|nr:biopolymer transporter ExbD [Candidatus Omnitrophota bacterium]